MVTRTGESVAVVSQDAKNRAIRSFFQGLGIDVGIAVVLLLVLAFDDIQWTQTYWLALAASLGRTILQSAVSYVSRVYVKPHVASDSDDGSISTEADPGKEETGL